MLNSLSQATEADSRNAQSLWQGIQADYKPAPQSCESNIPLLNNLNRFFARFEAQNSTCPQKTHPPLHEQPLCLSADSVKRTLAAINTRKAAGPDNIPGRALKDCAEELKDVFTDIFNTSLKQAIVPSCFKAATIKPVPKKTAPSCFNDYRPVALTPIIMKCFERLVMSHIKAILPHPGPPPVCIPSQTVHRGCNLLCPPPSPHPPGKKRLICCVLSPLLFTLLTHDCTATYSNNHIVKFADDTTLVGLITKGDETQYRLEVDLLTTWCRDNNLLLNVSKTKEIVVDFRRGHTQHLPLTIDGAVVERVSSTKFLEVHISEDLSWTTNTASLAKKSSAPPVLPSRKLRRASAPPAIMTTFYRGTIESILSSLSLKQPNISLISEEEGGASCLPNPQRSEGTVRPQTLEVTKGHNFSIVCSSEPQGYTGGSFRLLLSGSNQTWREPAQDHSAQHHLACFLFHEANDFHQGNYSCVFEVTVDSRHFNSTPSELLTVTVKVSWLLYLLAAGGLVLLLLLLLSIFLVWRCCLGNRRKKASLSEARYAGNPEGGVTYWRNEPVEDDERDYESADDEDDEDKEDYVNTETLVQGSIGAAVAHWLALWTCNRRIAGLSPDQWAAAEVPLSKAPNPSLLPERRR
ncbi:hypothetical protein AALO_G00228740 [Alosa alosa]|uniref:Alkylated DNA repair protein AlkB homologue 8 N-terminal domain-containing protein n=1 Tax=Alosa alosa TaxID=278164 RepID=A0AAV6FXW2_9TELE|nr:hypothetical protein AALO_G00228740 [Alosa alosa]